MKKFLFIALSHSQERYYRALDTQLTSHLGSQYHGKVVRIANIKGGSYRAAKNWCKKKNIHYHNWLFFKLKKQTLGKKPALLTKIIKPALSLEALKFFDAFKTIYTSFNPNTLVVYNGAHYKQQAAIDLAKYSGARVLYHELGCLPNTTAIDPQGVNYLNAVPREAHFYQQYKLSSTNNTYNTQAPALIPKQLVARETVKQASVNQTLPEKYIFVPFQVHDDTQVLLHSPWLADMSALYALLESSINTLPTHYCFVIKEHPSDKLSYPQLHNKHPRIVFANGNNTQELIEQSQAVATINSTVGIEALLLKKPVITLGNAFYNIEGIVYHVENQTQFETLITTPNTLKYDAELSQIFLQYLWNCHLVEGRPKTFNDEHITTMAARMILLSESS